jgi:predicted transcriptional regulator
MLHLAEASRACHLAAPSARWHLKILKGAGLVQAVRSAREVRYFVTGTVDEASRDLLLALHRGRALPLLASVAASPGLTVRQLAEEIGSSSQAVLRASQHLQAYNLIETLRDGKFVRSYPT